MRIGILGAGRFGGALGKALAGHGHRVLFGVRDPSAPKVRQLLADAGPDACAGTLTEAGAFGTVVALAVPWPAAQDALRQAGDLTGKTLLDVTNPFQPDLSGLSVPAETSAGQMVAAWAPGARVVKAFNSIGYRVIGEPRYAGANPAAFYAGDDGDAKATAAQLAADLGFEPFDAGPLSQARRLEELALFWVVLGVRRDLGFEHAWALLRR